MTIEIVDFPIKNGGFFHCYVNVYQRVYSHIQSHTNEATAEITSRSARKSSEANWSAMQSCQMVGCREFLARGNDVRPIQKAILIDINWLKGSGSCRILVPKIFNVGMLGDPIMLYMEPGGNCSLLCE